MIKINSFALFMFRVIFVNVFKTGIHIRHQQSLVCKFLKTEKKGKENKKKKVVPLNFKDQMESYEFWKERYVMKEKKRVKLVSYFFPSIFEIIEDENVLDIS